MTPPHDIHLRRRSVLGLALGAGAGAKTLLLSACGGAVGEDGTGAYEPAISVGSVNGLSETSVSVNGINFTIEPATTLLDGMGRPLTPDALRLGQWLEISGQVNDEQGLGIADKIQVRNSVRGTVSAIDGGGAVLTVLQTAVRYSEKATVLDGIDSAVALGVGDVVEVHGPLGAVAGTLEATRLELLASAPNIELRGRVSAVDIVRRRAVIGRQPVNFSQATQTLRKTIADGQVLRVSASTSPSAGSDWLVERIANDAPLPANLGFAYAEGVTSNWREGPYFDLDGLEVDGSTASNRNAVKSDEQRVAVIGSIRNGVLVAKSVAPVRPGRPVLFNLSGPISAFVSPAHFRVRKVLVNASAATFVGGAATDLTNDKRVRVTGTLHGRRLRATRVEFLAG